MVSNKLALALAGLAVVVASTGTAVAVTATKVNIADPTTPSRRAHVDSNGRLLTNGITGAYTTYTYSNLISNIPGDNFVTTPTTASLALTSISLSHPSIVASSPNTQVRVFLYRVISSSKTTCTPSAYKQLMAWNLEPGDDLTADLSIPLLIKPTGTTPYCLSLYIYALTGTYGAGYYPFGSVSWYVAAGTYTAAAGAKNQQLSPAQIRARNRPRADR